MTLMLGSWEILFLLLLFLITIGILRKVHPKRIPKSGKTQMKNGNSLGLNEDKIDVFSTLLFYVSHDGNREGPYNLKQIKDYPLRPDTLITTNTLDGAWYRADQFECLKELFHSKDSYKINSDGEVIRDY